MKLLIVTCIKEHTQIVETLFSKVGITIFSTTETTGFKDGRPINLSDNWFGKTGEQYDSAVLFSFTDEVIATRTLSAVNEHNKETQSDYPIHAFIVPVENSTS
jgi:hypothetical protein